MTPCEFVVGNGEKWFSERCSGPRRVLDLLKLKTFQTLAATHSFTRAAAALGYSQSNVTTHIQALERELGAALFDRLHNSVVLTSAGRRALEYADRLLALADEAKTAVQKNLEIAGSISISAPEALCVYYLPHVLRLFQAHYPRVQLSFVSHTVTSAQIQAVVRGDVDLAFALDQPVLSEHLVVQLLRREDVLIVAAPDHPIGRTDEVTLHDLASQRILIGGPECPLRLLFERILGVAQVSPSNVLQLSSIEAIKQCAMAGVGVAALPGIAVAGELQSKRLVSKLYPDLGFPLRIQMLRHRKRQFSPAVGALWKLSEQNLPAY